MGEKEKKRAEGKLWRYVGAGELQEGRTEPGTYVAQDKKGMNAPVSQLSCLSAAKKSLCVLLSFGKINILTWKALNKNPSVSYFSWLWPSAAQLQYLSCDISGYSVGDMSLLLQDGFQEQCLDLKSSYLGEIFIDMLWSKSRCGLRSCTSLTASVPRGACACFHQIWIWSPQCASVERGF